MSEKSDMSAGLAKEKEDSSGVNGMIAATLRHIGRLNDRLKIQ